jgi:hypothetical protein
MYVGQMNFYKTIRQKIEALPPTSSAADVLKMSDECEPEKPKGMNIGRWVDRPSNSRMTRGVRDAEF